MIPIQHSNASQRSGSCYSCSWLSRSYLPSRSFTSKMNDYLRVLLSSHLNRKEPGLEFLPTRKLFHSFSHTMQNIVGGRNTSVRSCTFILLSSCCRDDEEETTIFGLISSILLWAYFVDLLFDLYFRSLICSCFLFSMISRHSEW